MSAPEAYYITTPIYYVNDVPHIGHAYTTLACDVIARFKRLDGKRVLFLTGTDEHGPKVEKTAQEQGLTPQELCDRVSSRFYALVEAMDFSVDDFIRTTQARHVQAVQSLWRAMKANGALYLGSYSGWYAVRDESYYAESELVKGPDGTWRAPTGAPVEWVEEPSWFFRLSEWQDRLLELYSRPGFVLPESRLNEVRSFVQSGLKDLSVSRTTVRWGIPVPDDPDHVIYVWVDALTNYLTAAGYPDTNSETYRTFWPADLHMVGKDILRFHAVFWPAFLMSAGLEPAERVYAHGWWTNEGQKISKSLGNVIDPFGLIEKYGLDSVRYFLMREVPFGNDGDFSHTAMVNRINGDLANDLGNLCQRSLSMIARNCDAAVPQPSEFRDTDRVLLLRSENLLDTVRVAIDQQEIHNALIAIWSVIGEANRYFAGEEPWALRKTDPERMRTVLYVTAEVIRRVALLIQPVVPNAAARILDQLGVPADERGFGRFGDAASLSPGTALPKPEGVFPRWTEREEASA